MCQFDSWKHYSVVLTNNNQYTVQVHVPVYDNKMVKQFEPSDICGLA